jgi:hypothetical protein
MVWSSRSARRFAADIVGFSKLVGEDEAGILGARAVRKSRDVDVGEFS